MSNVLRIYNDETGVELCQRTGRNPNFQYVQIGCSKAAERNILAFARRSVGKPFSMSAMARSVVWPRVTNHQNYFCAELVAAALQTGGLLDMNMNPAAASPESIHRAFAQSGTTTGNPFTLRQMTQAQPSASNNASNGTDTVSLAVPSGTRAASVGLAPKPRLSNGDGSPQEGSRILQRIRSWLPWPGHSHLRRPRRVSTVELTEAGRAPIGAAHRSGRSVERASNRMYSTMTNRTLTHSLPPSRTDGTPNANASNANRMCTSHSLAESRIREAVRMAVRSDATAGAATRHSGTRDRQLAAQRFAGGPVASGD